MPLSWFPNISRQKGSDRQSLGHSLMQQVTAEAEQVPLELVEVLIVTGAEWSEQLWGVLQSYTSLKV